MDLFCDCLNLLWAARNLRPKPVEACLPFVRMLYIPKRHLLWSSWYKTNTPHFLQVGDSCSWLFTVVYSCSRLLCITRLKGTVFTLPNPTFQNSRATVSPYLTLPCFELTRPITVLQSAFVACWFNSTSFERVLLLDYVYIHHCLDSAQHL